jgi:hypothetical protein
LRDGTVTALDTTGAFVDGRQVSVHVTGETTSTWHFLSGGRDLTKSVTVGRKICENNQNVLLELVGVVFGGGESETRRDDTLDPAAKSVISQ